MYEIVKIAGLSAVLAGALLVAAGQHEDRSTAGKFLTDRLEVAPAPATLAPQAHDATAEPGCTGTWPYRACAEATPARAKIRIITTDARAITSQAH